MTPSKLQDTLSEYLKNELSGFQLKNVKGDIVPLNIYKQNLPAKKSAKDTEHFPFILARISDGEFQDDQENTEKNTCKICLIIGIYDDSEDYQGEKDVENIIEKIVIGLKKKKFLNGQFELINPLRWTIHDEDTYPNFYGGVETNWNLPLIQMEDPLI